MKMPSSLPRSLQLFCARNQNLIDEVSDERDTDDGIWIFLKYGWCFDNSCHIVHEDTARAIIQAFKSVRACSCPECEAYGHHAAAPSSADQT